MAVPSVEGTPRDCALKQSKPPHAPSVCQVNQLAHSTMTSIRPRVMAISASVALVLVILFARSEELQEVELAGHTTTAH